MLIHLERRAMAWQKPGDPAYPDQYLVFGQYFIGRDGAGGYVLGNATQPGGNPFNPNQINYEDRRARLLARVAPYDDQRYVANAVRPDNPQELILPDGSTFAYNNVEPAAYADQYPVGAANGAILRFGFEMASSFSTGFSSQHSVTNDRYNFDGVGLSLSDFFSRSLCAREIVRLESSGAYTRISTDPTGYVDQLARRRLNSTTQRIVSDVIQKNGSIWTWLIRPYAGALSDGAYLRPSPTEEPRPLGNLELPNAEIATLTRPFLGSASVYRASGFQSNRAATLQGSTTFADAPLLANGSFPLPTRNDASSGQEPMWSLYGGAVRIDHLRQVSLDGGPWFRPRGDFNVELMPFLGDRAVRAITPEMNVTIVPNAKPLVAPP